jgi:Uracil phosphoribosyltransferase
MSSSLTAPTSQTSPASLPPSVFTLPQTAQLEALFTIIRDKNTSRGDFLFYSDRIIRLLVEEGLNHLPVVPKVVETPTVSRYAPKSKWRDSRIDGVYREAPTTGLDLKARYVEYQSYELAR